MGKLFACLLFICLAVQVDAQQKCMATAYHEKILSHDLSLQKKKEDIEAFTRQALTPNLFNARSAGTVRIIQIPVVIHILYHTPEENVKTERILDQLKALNRDYRRKNADTISTPAAFVSVAADMEIEFVLAKSDPAGRSTSGIVRKYTPVKYWESDDKVKFNASYGDNAWDASSYLNIWICNLRDAMGYATLPGSDPAKDGVVISYTTISNSGSKQGNNGRTLTHETGHWLNLYHLWGDTYCGDDLVDDTPRQSTYTPGCPTGIRRTCGNNQSGDMYMNYMDFTNDACMNLFTQGQKQRARALFEPGGYRSSILKSKALNLSTIEAAPVPDYYPQWLDVQIYPNPATNRLNVYLEYDERWRGNVLSVIDLNGRIWMKKMISADVEQIDISKLSPGIYFIRTEKEGEKVLKKFIKL